MSLSPSLVSPDQETSASLQPVGPSTSASSRILPAPSSTWPSDSARLAEQVGQLWRQVLSRRIHNQGPNFAEFASERRHPSTPVPGAGPGQHA